MYMIVPLTVAFSELLVYFSSCLYTDLVSVMVQHNERMRCGVC